MTRILIPRRHVALLLPAFVAILYAAASEQWVPFGGIRGDITRTDLLAVLLLTLSLAGFRAIASGIQCACICALVAGAYLLFDIHYLILGSQPRLSDLANLVSLGHVSPMWAALTIAVSITLLALGLIPFLISVRRADRPVHMIGLLLSLGAIGFGLYAADRGLSPQHVKSNLEKWGNWDDFGNTRRYGRLTSVLVSRGSETAFRSRLANQAPVPSVFPTFTPISGTVDSLPGINIVVLESFTDPRLYHDATFSQSPLAPTLREFMGSNQFDRITVPRYGSGTAQTEFELLTAAPALSRYSNIEFNMLNGYPISGLVAGLQAAGYTHRGFIATSPRFYNSRRAYQSLGLTNLCFVDLCEGFARVAPYRHIHDSDLLNQVNQAACGAPPCLRYVLGMYGHVELERRHAERPDVLEAQLDGEAVGTFNDLANQFYYRTDAIAAFLSEHNGPGSSAITLIISDHLPPLLNDKIRYKHGKKETIALLFQGETRVSVSGLHSWQLPLAIMKLLGVDNPEVDDDARETWYHHIMQQGTIAQTARR